MMRRSQLGQQQQQQQQSQLLNKRIYDDDDGNWSRTRAPARPLRGRIAM